MAPSIRRVALLANPAYPGRGQRARRLGDTGRPDRLDVRYVGARTADELKAAFAKIAADKAQAISLLADSFTVQNRSSIMAFANEQRIPVVSSWPVFAEAGALCTHGPRLAIRTGAWPTTPIASCAAPSPPICRSSSRRRSRRSSISRPPTPST
jgi:putative ABC transport system substrate-binding protein